MCNDDVPRTGERLLFAQSARAGRRLFETSCQACTTKWCRPTMLMVMIFTHRHRHSRRSLIEHRPIMLPTTIRMQTHTQAHRPPNRSTNFNGDTTKFLWTVTRRIQAEMSPRPTRRPQIKHKVSKRSSASAMDQHQGGSRAPPSEDDEEEACNETYHEYTAKTNFSGTSSSSTRNPKRGRSTRRLVSELQIAQARITFGDESTW